MLDQSHKRTNKYKTHPRFSLFKKYLIVTLVLLSNHISLHAAESAKQSYALTHFEDKIVVAIAIEDMDLKNFQAQYQRPTWELSFINPPSRRCDPIQAIRG